MGIFLRSCVRCELEKFQWQMMRATQCAMVHSTGFEFLHVTAYSHETSTPDDNPRPNPCAESGKDQTKKEEKEAAPKATATEIHDAQPKPIPAKPSSSSKVQPAECKSHPGPSEPKQPMPATLSTVTDAEERSSTCNKKDFVRTRGKPKVVREASPPGQNKTAVHQVEPLRPPQNAIAEPSSGNTPCAAKTISPIPPPPTQEPAKNENAAKFGVFSRTTPPPAPKRLPPVENEDKRPKRVESPGHGTEIQESPKRSKLDDAKDMQPGNKMGAGKGRKPPRSVPVTVLGPNGTSFVKPTEEDAGQEPSSGTPMQPSAKLDSNNPGHAQENVRDATPNEKSNAAPVPPRIKEDNEGTDLGRHGGRKPMSGKMWVGYVCLSKLHEDALFDQMTKRAINFEVPGVDPVARSTFLPSIPRFAFILWADEGVAQGQALAESERVLEEYPRGYCVVSAAELSDWMQKLFAFKCRRITLAPADVGEHIQVDVDPDDVCYGVVPRVLCNVDYWQNTQVTSDTKIPRDKITTPQDFVWPDQKYV